MTAFLLYILRGGLYLGLFYTFFLLVMRKTTFFRLNRVLLLAGSYLCLLLPALEESVPSFSCGRKVVISREDLETKLAEIFK